MCNILYTLIRTIIRGHYIDLQALGFLTTAAYTHCTGPKLTTSGICETPRARSLFYFPCVLRITVPGTPHDSIPHGACSAPLRPTKKLYHGPEPRHPR